MSGAMLVLALLGAGPAGQGGGSASSCRVTLAPRSSGGPQVADTTFDPPLARPTFAPGRGPLVLLDEAHFNFHTAAGRYAPFVRLLRKDGFRVEPLRASLSAATLAPARILVIANAQSEKTATGAWTLPNPSAFTAEEIAAVERWVGAGGSLLLIADHMPFPGAAEALAQAFGIYLSNGYATDATCGVDELVFRRSNGTLAAHPIFRGRSAREHIDSVRSFTGSAFRISAGAPLLQLLPDAVVLMPVTAWQFGDSTPRFPAGGMLQGAAVPHGRGRVAMFGEAAMFSAQVSGAERRPMGMNAPRAGENPQFLLNVMHWLGGLLPLR